MKIWHPIYVTPYLCGGEGVDGDPTSEEESQAVTEVSAPSDNDTATEDASQDAVEDSTEVETDQSIL